MYFNKNLSLLSNFRLSAFTDYDNFAKIFFDITIPIFKDNLVLYQLSALIMLIIFSLSFFVVILKITKSKLISFTSVILFSTNYVALFEYMANGNYQRFIQRFPTLIPLIFSFYFLWCAFTKKNNPKRYFFLGSSIFLYALAVLMGHFATLMLPIFVIFPIIQILDNKQKYKDISLRISVIVVYLALSYFITRHGAQHPDMTPLQFLTTEKNLALFTFLYRWRFFGCKKIAQIIYIVFDIFTVNVLNYVFLYIH